MIRQSWRWLAAVAVLAVVGFVSTPDRAYGFHGHWRSGGWGWGGWGCCASAWNGYYDSGWDSCCDSGYGVYGGYGSYGGCGACGGGLFHRRAYVSTWGCCYPTVVADCCTATPAYGGGLVSPATTGPDQRPTLAPPPTPQPPVAPAPGEAGPSTFRSQPGPAPTPGGATLPEQPAPPTTRYQIERDAVLLTVLVPADAKVFVNGHETKSKGTVRNYLSRGLEEGKVYPYSVVVEVPNKDGEPASLTKTIHVTAGEKRQVAFSATGLEERIARLNK